MDSRKSLVPVTLREGAERGADAVVVPAQIGEASGGQPPGRLDQDVVDGASDRLRVVGQSEGIQIGAHRLREQVFDHELVLDLRRLIGADHREVLDARPRLDERT